MHSIEFAHELSSARVWLLKLAEALEDAQINVASELIDSLRGTRFPHRNWKKLLLESFANKNTLYIYGRQVTFVNLNDARALLEELIINDLYGLEALPELTNVIDAGAANGFFSSLVLRKFSGVRIDLIEPNPINVDLIKKNLESELTGKQIVLHEGALHTSKKYVNIKVPCDENVWGGLGATISDRDRLEKRDIRTLRVNSINLTELLDQQVDLFKCDIEGAEYNVIRSAGVKIKNCKRILVELHADVKDFSSKLSSLIAFLTKQGFTLSLYDGAVSCASVFLDQPPPSFMLCAINKNQNG